ncbi:MAG: methyltransferase [Burkholderiaceae bacterium]|nr:MAG: methyltransferase [Burkholderiaceae bacterium]
MQNKEVLERSLQGSHRSEANRLRDKYRHPVETLTFFGVKPNSNVVEITPGRGWYSEILAPLLRSNGEFTAIIYDADLTNNAYLKKLNGFYKTKLGDNPEIYSNVRLEEINHKSPIFDLDSSADFVLTFRNVHNWAKSGTTDEMFRSFYKSLKTGGVLGVVEHRARSGTPLSQQIKSGYMTEEFVIKTAEKAGFVFSAGSNINNNSLDSKDHKKGVWTLLPVQRGLSDKEKIVYAKIGESDRMTLKFVKP